MLINSIQGWCTEMEKWIGDARAAEVNEEDEDDSDLAGSSNLHLPAARPGSRSLQWKPAALAILFGGCKVPPSRLHPDEINTEAALMQALAEREEDNRLDDSAVEINSDDEFTG